MEKKKIIIEKVNQGVSKVSVEDHPEIRPVVGYWDQDVDNLIKELLIANPQFFGIEIVYL